MNKFKKKFVNESEGDPVWSKKPVSQEVFDENPKLKNCLTKTDGVLIYIDENCKWWKDYKEEKEGKKEKEEKVVDPLEAERKAEIAKQKQYARDVEYEQKKWRYDCWQSGYTFGCYGEPVIELQKHLNRIDWDGLIDDKTGELIRCSENGKWGKQTQKKLEKNFPDLADKVFTTKMIDDLGKEIDKMVEERYKEKTGEIKIDDEKPEEEKDRTVDDLELESFIMKRLKLLKEEETNLEKTERKTKERNFLIKLKTDFSYCLPKWYKQVQVKESKETESYYMSGVCDTTGFDDLNDLKSLDGTTYHVFTNLEMKKVLEDGSYDDSVQTITCDDIRTYFSTINNRAPFELILKKFGLVSQKFQEESDFINSCNKVTENINELLKTGYRSDNFKEWKNFLASYFRGNENVTKISDVPYEYNNLPQSEKNGYVDDSKNIQTNLGWNIEIYKKTDSPQYRTYTKEEGIDALTCKKILSKYLANAIVATSGAGTIPVSTDIQKMKGEILKCKSQNRFGDDDKYTSDEVFGDTMSSYRTIDKSPFTKISDTLTFKQITDFLAGKDSENIFGKNRKYTGKVLIRPNAYIIDRINESFDLKDKIKLTLNETVLEKRKITQQEKLVRSRVNMLLENSEFKSKNQRRDFIVNLLKETLQVEAQGIDTRIINEEFWDVIKGFFGDKGSQAVFQSFKNKMAEWLTSHLSPKKADGWIGDCIRKTVKEIDMEDVHLITDCKFLTRKISRSIVEKLNEKMSNDELKDEGLYDVVRGGMASNVKSAKFRAHIEEKVQKMICPILYDMSNRFDDTFEKMKKRTLNIFD